MLTLYYWPGASSVIPHVTLEEIGAPYERKLVNLARGGHQFLPVGEIELVQGRHDAGIADEDVDSSECLYDGINSDLDLSFIRHVHANPERAPISSTKLRRRRVGSGRVQIGDGDLGALAGDGTSM